jgi:predicted phosphoribosyltransferase
MHDGLQFTDRREAGHTLARLLAGYLDATDAVVLALPRGGVPVGFEVARTLRLPLDVLVVRKIGVPGQEEYAMGAIASGGVRVANPDVADLRIPAAAVEEATQREAREVERREKRYRGDRPALDVARRTVILVDDGMATGSTMRAAVRAVRERDPKRIVVAVPIASAEACEAMREEADEVICALTPRPFIAVGMWYSRFDQTSDEEVRRLLDLAGAQASARRATS